jgi:hypothetical protein
MEVGIAGLVLGSVSLSFQLFAGCVKGFLLLSSAHEMGHDANKLICMLNLQEELLVSWARRAGLMGPEGKLDKRLNEILVNETLGELSNLLTNTADLKKRFGIEIVAGSSSASSEGHELADPTPAAEPSVRALVPEHVRQEILFRAKIIQSRHHFFKRLWWAASTMERFEDFVRRIDGLIKGLRDLLDDLNQELISQNVSLLLGRMIGVEDKVDRLLAWENTLVQQREMDGRFSPAHDIGALALAAAAGTRALKFQIGDIEDVRASGSTVTESKAIVSRSVLPPLYRHLLATDSDTESGAATMATTYDGVPVLVEWKEISHQAKIPSIRRAENLAILLNAPKHPSFRSLRCRGLIEDSDASRIAFVFDHPYPETSPKPISLRALFQKSAPSVTARIQLAREISRTIKLFHTAEWLHKSIRSENFLFFPKYHAPGASLSSSQVGDLISNPFLVGFNFSRFNSATEPSEQPSENPQLDIYRHPEALGEPSTRFNKMKDNYALGTVLLEIGEWRSLRSIVSKVVNFKEVRVPLTEIAKVRAFLLNEETGGTSKLKAHMGDIYAKAVRMCLSGSIAGRGVDEGMSPLTLFSPSPLEIVVQDLERCVI